jgi:hypothetical protein
MKIFSIEVNYKQILVAGTLVLALCIASFLYMRSEITESKPYRLSESLIVQNAAVQSALGGNLKCRLISWQQSEGSGGSYGSATFEIRVTGDKGEGDVETNLEKRNGKWVVIGAVLRGTDNTTIDLVAGR